MKNITYLLGAGASADTVPTVVNFNKDIEAIKKMLANNFLEKNLNPPIFKSLPPILQEKNDLLNNIILDFEWLLMEADNHQTIDTLAKKFYLTNAANLIKLKKILATYFLIRQALIKPHKRYDSFLAAISHKEDEKITFAKNIKILTWNYDLQLELSIKRYVPNNISEIKEIFQIFPHYNSIEKNAESLLDLNNFATVKLNGNAYWSRVDNKEKHPQSVLDTFFSKYEAAGSIIAEVVTEYDFIFNQTNDGSRYLKMFNFAWETDSTFEEKYSGYNGNLQAAENLARNTEILVVIGYSFPVFNREIDSRLFNAMEKLEKVYIQDIRPDEIQSTMTNAFKIFQEPFHKSNRKKNFQLENNVNQFIIPFEL